MIVYIYLRNPYNPLNKFFILFLFFVGIWIFSETFNAFTISREAASFSTRIGAIGWSFMGPMFLIFVLLFVKENHLVKSFWFITALLGVSSILLFLTWRSDLIINYSPERFFWGWQVPSGKLFFLLGLWAAFLFLFSFFHILRFYFKTKLKEEKSQAVLLLCAMTLPFIFGILGHVILPSFVGHLFLFDAIGFPFTVFPLAYFLGLAIIKYRLFIISPTFMAPGIINTMSELLIVFNIPFFTIEFVNKAATDVLGYSKEEFIGSNIDKIFAGGNVWDTFSSRGLNPLLRGKVVKNLETKFLTKDGKEIPVNFSASSIKSAEKNATMVVALAYDISKTKKLVRSLEERIGQLKDANISLEKALGERLSK